METLTAVLDVLFGWLLYLPRSVVILLVALATSVLLTLSRRWTTNQDQLRRAKADLARLKQLLRQSKRAKDKDTVKRIRTTAGAVNLIRIKAEGWPLLVSIIPITLLAVWGFSRLDYYAPRPGDKLLVQANYAGTCKGKLTTLLAPEDVEMLSSPLQSVSSDRQDSTIGSAEWTIRPTRQTSSLSLVFGQEDETVTHTFSVGGRFYDNPIQMYPGKKIIATQINLRPVRFLGVVPGLPELACPPWLFAYLVIIIPAVPLLRRVLKIY